MGILLKKRIYESWSETDGFRVLVDRLWPRGISKEKAHLDLWFKDITPSHELRKWFKHSEEKWEEFQLKYLEELDERPQAIAKFRELIDQNERITLIFAAKSEEFNHVRVLMEVFGNG